MNKAPLLGNVSILSDMSVINCLFKLWDFLTDYPMSNVKDVHENKNNVACIAVLPADCSH